MSDTGKITVVVGGQFGSEAKGAVAAYLAKRSDAPVSAVRVAGPNAGHTVYGRCPRPVCPEHTNVVVPGDPGEGPHPWRLRQVPVPAVSRPDSKLYIAAGSEVSHDVLLGEVLALDAAGYRVSARLIVDRSATIITEEHIEMEQSHGINARLGSTAKGIGAARASRIWREAATWGTGSPAYQVDVASLLRTDLADGGHVIIEGTQGYGLGLHTKYYPYTTSSDCRAIDFLAMAGVSPWDPAVRSLDVWVVLRTRPIRVAGNSGPLGGETDWDALGLPKEHTTVTKKVRRVGEWDGDLAREAVAANGSDVKVALTMVDQVFPWIAGRTNMHDLDDEQLETICTYLDKVEAEIEAPIWLVGTSPTTMISVWPSRLNAGGGRPGVV